MPTYEFVCSDCEKAYEIKASLEEKSRGLKLKCPACGSSQGMQVFSGIMVNCAGKVQEVDKGSCGCSGCCHNS